MITEVKKYLILGTEEDLDVFYQRAQQEGFIEFISSSRKSQEVPEKIQILLKAMKILKKLPSHKECEGEWNPDEILHLAEKVIELKSSIEKNEEDFRVLEAEIARVSPLGNFSLEDIQYIEKEGDCSVQFFCGKSGKVDGLVQKDGVFHVGTFFDLEYFISVSPEPVTFPGAIEMRIDQSLSDLKDQKDKIADFIHLIELELKHLSGYLEYFHEVLIEELNKHHLATAKGNASFPMEGSSLFSVEAWIPSSKISRMFSLLSGLSVHCEQIQIEKDDSLPTVMENKGVGRLGEDLVRIYDLPSVKDKDPSTWVFWFFALFFAMIIADAGYGLLYLTAAAFFKWKMPAFKGAAKRFFKMVVIISLCVVAWGVLTCSYFGLSISPNSFLGKISPMQSLVIKKADYHMHQKDEVYTDWIHAIPALKEVKTGKEFVIEGVKQTPIGLKHEVYESFSDSILLELSLVLGIFHLSLSLCRYGRRNWANFAWIAFMVGGYLFFPTMLHATSMANFLNIVHPPAAAAVGLQLIYVGIGGALCLAFIQHKLKGLAEITKLIEIFGDVLSYLRLYALALAATILAETFNSMGEVVGLVGGFFVIVLGHGINIALGLMSGVIHGLRLNFIEWYHYSFDGGGRLFNPLMLLKSKDD
jgi:V/A-type H+/Na+-transporting ATPase subunit I